MNSLRSPIGRPRPGMTPTNRTPSALRLARRAQIRGVYAITPDDPDTARLVERSERVIRGGARVIQYRNKMAIRSLRTAQATALAEICARRNALLIINDHIDLALEVDAAGLHVGTNDGDLAELRRLIGPDRLLGASCYDRIDRAEFARASGADYLAFGSVFQSRTKPAATRATLALFAQARVYGLPLVGIGGVNLRNIDTLIEAGADAAALISDLFEAYDIRRHTYELTRRFRLQHNAGGNDNNADADLEDDLSP